MKITSLFKNNFTIGSRNFYNRKIFKIGQLFDFFFVPPRFTFAVSDVQYLVTFAVMLVVALVVGQLTAGLKQQAEAATQREHRVRSLYDMARDLSRYAAVVKSANIKAE
mgnify:CR=1 FL=1